MAAQFSIREIQRELQRRASEELRKRRDKDPEAYRVEVIRALRNELYDKQVAVLEDPSRRISLCCSRRAGKSELAARMLVIALLEGQRNDYCLFAARTLTRAKQIILDIVSRINDQYQLDFHIASHIGQITTPHGSVLILLGVDDQIASEKVRGSRYKLAFCDEASTYEEHLDALVTDCIAPGTMDLDPPGRIIVAGTPGKVRKGYWHDVACGVKPAFSCHTWTLLDNPFLKNIPALLKEEREANGWSESDPVYQREYKGVWSADETTLVYSYNADRNDVRELPAGPADVPQEEWIRDHWLTTVAADIGYTDDFACVVLGSPPHSKDIYVLHSYKEAGLLVGDQASRISELKQRYKPARTVIDAGGMGKLTFEEYNSRYGAASGGRAVQAQKRGKIDAIGMMNSDLRAGRLKVWMPQARLLTEEWRTLPWQDEARDKEHSGFRNHIADSCIYGWREHRAYLAQAAAREPTLAEQEAERDAKYLRRASQRQRR